MKLKQLTTAFLVLITIATNAQDTIYYDKHGSEILNAKKAKSYLIIRRDSLNKNLAVATKYFKSGKIRCRTSLVDESSVPVKERKSNLHAFLYSKDCNTKWLNNGKYMEWYENGKIKKEIDFKNGGSNNLLITYWQNGNIKRREQYNDSWKMLEGKCYDPDGLPVMYSPYYVEPTFDFKEFGSIQVYINKKLQYSTAPSEKKPMGKMVIMRQIDSKGKAFKIRIKKGIEPKLDLKVISLLKKFPKCITPALVNEEPQSCTSTYSVVICKPIYTVDLFMNPSGKDSVYYDKDGFIQEGRQGAADIELLTTNPKNTNELVQSVYYQSGKLKSILTIDKRMSIENIKNIYENLNENLSLPVRSVFSFNKVLNGKSMTWYENGQLKCELNFNSNILNGEQVYYAEDGKVTNRAVFENGKLISGDTPATNTQTIAEVMPQFPGGLSALSQYLSNNIRYPKTATEEGVSGVVVVKFVVKKDGSIGQTEVLRSVNVEIDKEAVRVIQNMPNWIPGTQEGVPVNVWYSLPIRFKLDTATNNRNTLQNNNLRMHNNSYNRSHPSGRY